LSAVEFAAASPLFTKTAELSQRLRQSDIDAKVAALYGDKLVGDSSEGPECAGLF